MFNYCFFTVKHKVIRFALVYPTLHSNSLTRSALRMIFLDLAQRIRCFSYYLAPHLAISCTTCPISLLIREFLAATNASRFLKRRGSSAARKNLG